MKRGEVRKLASACAVKCKSRGLGTLENRLQTALDLEDYSRQLADRSAEHFQAASAQLQRLSELARIAADTLYELAQTEVHADHGDIEVRVCGSFTVDAIGKLIARMRVAQRQAAEYRSKAIGTIASAALATAQQEAVS
jgi:uncharacterized protein YigA (DUF484 family)